MKRIPEPELMLEPGQVAAYASADFERPHSSFIKLFIDKFPGEDLSGKAIDLGCGPGDITFRFASEFPNIKIHAVDGSLTMIRYANNLLASRDDIRERIIFIHSMIDKYRRGHKYNWIISNSLLHHLHDPRVFWESIKKFAAEGCRIMIMDLYRPASMEEAMELTNKYTKDGPDILKRDFYNSLLASFNVDEVKDQIGSARLDLSVEKVTDRHMIIYGSV